MPRSRTGTKATKSRPRGWTRGGSQSRRSRAPEGWPESGEFQGREAVIGQLRRLKEAWSDESVELVSIESAGDRVLVNVRWLGHGESSGLELDMPFWNVYRLVDGKISHIGFHTDEESARAEFEAD